MKSIYCIADHLRRAVNIAERLQHEQFPTNFLSFLVYERILQSQRKQPRCNLHPWFTHTKCWEIPDTEHIVLTGSFAESLSIEGCFLGGLADTFVYLGIPQAKALVFDELLDEGCFLLRVQVHSPAKLKDALMILEDEGAEELCIGEEIQLLV